MKLKTIILTTLILLIFTACTPGVPVISETAAAENPLTDIEKARVVLTAYLDALSRGDYAKAAELYGGDLDVLRGYNPKLAPEDEAALLENGCELNGFQCLPMLIIAEEQTLSETSFEFTVRLVAEDGSVFTIGNCCGADPNNTANISLFPFEVIKQGEQFQVLTLPPYLP